MLSEHIEKLPEASRRLLHHTRFAPGDEWALKECLQASRKVKVASDGSYLVR